MEQFTAAVRAVCVVSAGICLADSLFSGTKLRGQLKMLLELILAMVITAPFVSGGVDFELPEIQSFDLSDYSYSTELYQQELGRQSAENVEAVLYDQLSAAGITADEITVEVNILEDNSISITKVTVTADDLSGAAEIIRSCLGAETEVVDGSL